MVKRERAICYKLDTAIVDIFKRQVGQISSSTFARGMAASEDLVLHLDLHKKLENNTGSVYTTVGFSSDGEILVSSSFDCRVTLWDWKFGHIKHSFHSGHYGSVSQAKIMPFTDERSIVTCSADDGQVRHAMILERGYVETKSLAKPRGLVHNLAVEHGSPYIFYTCGRDGLVQHFDLRTEAPTELLKCQSVRRDQLSLVRLNAITINPRNPNLFAVAGGDQYARLYDIRKCTQDGSSTFGQPADYFCPQHLIGGKLGEITGLAFSDQSELLASYDDEFLYLFTKDNGLGPVPHLASPKIMDCDAHKLKCNHFLAQSSSSFGNQDHYGKTSPLVYKGHTNFGIAKDVNFFGPRCEYVVSGSYCGGIFIWRKRNGEILPVLEGDELLVTCVQPHPHTSMLASSGMDRNIKLWEPKAAKSY